PPIVPTGWTTGTSTRPPHPLYTAHCPYTLAVVIVLLIAFKMHKLRQRLTSISTFRTRAQCLLIGIAEGNCRTYQALLRDTQQRLRISPALPFEPANA